MSSISITSVPKGGDEGMPQWVREELVGVRFGLCSPQSVIFVGCKSRFETGDIGHFHDAYPVSWEWLLHELRTQRPNLAQWFQEAFPHHSATPNGTTFLFGEDCCEYEP